MRWHQILGAASSPLCSAPALRCSGARAGLGLSCSREKHGGSRTVSPMDKMRMDSRNEMNTNQTMTRSRDMCAFSPSETLHQDEEHASKPPEVTR